MTRRQIIGAGAGILTVPAISKAGAVAARDEGVQRSPVSHALLRGASRTDLAPALRIHTLRLLHDHMGTDVDFYRQAAPAMLSGLKGNPGMQHVNLSNMAQAYAYGGGDIIAPDWGLIIEAAAQANVVNLNPLLVNGGDGLARQVGSLLDAAEAGIGYGYLARARLKAMDEGTDGAIVAGGAALVAAGATAVNVGIGIGTAAGATFTSSVVATVLVTGGGALLIIGVAILGYEIERMLTR